MSDGLPDPRQDPVSPLFAHMMNSAVRAGAGVIEKGIDMIKEAPAALEGLTAPIAKRVADAALSDKPSAPEGDTVKAWKVRELAKVQEVAPVNEKAQASALAAVGKDQGLSEGRTTAANDSHYAGVQGVSASIDAVGKPIAVAVQTQEQGLSV